MKTPTALLLASSFLFVALCSNAARPLNGTTNFTSTTANVKASGSASGASGITAFNVEGFNFNLTTVSSPATMNIEVWDGFVSSGNGVAFYEQSSTINPLITGIIITSNDGARFDFGSIGINATNSANGNATITVTGLNSSGNPISGATISGIASASALTVFNAGSNAAFNGVAKIRITSSDMNYVFIDNIVIANIGSTLPISWLDFTAAKKGNGIQLDWRTAMEQHTKQFTVQQSINGTEWTTLGYVNAAGNSHVIQHYTFFQSSPFAGANYYRLVQVDIDGKENFSRIIRIDFLETSHQLSVYPNPVRGGSLIVNLNKATTIQVINISGSIVLQKNMKANGDVLPLENLPKGVYRIKAGSENTSFVIQ